MVEQLLRTKDTSKRINRVLHEPLLLFQAQKGSFSVSLHAACCEGRSVTKMSLLVFQQADISLQKPEGKPYIWVVCKRL